MTDSVPAPSLPPNRKDKADPPAADNGQPAANSMADPAMTAAAEAVAKAAGSIANAASSVAKAAAPGAEVSLDRQRRINDLIEQIKESADKLAADQHHPRRPENPQPHAPRAALRLQGLHALSLAAAR